MVMVEIQNDLPAFQRTMPSTASVSWASTMRGERNVLSERRSATSTASRSGFPAVSAHIVMASSTVTRAYCLQLYN
jgi:hypothetical protein